MCVCVSFLICCSTFLSHNTLKDLMMRFHSNGNDGRLKMEAEQKSILGSQEEKRKIIPYIRLDPFCSFVFFHCFYCCSIFFFISSLYTYKWYNFHSVSEGGGGGEENNNNKRKRRGMNNGLFLCHDPLMGLSHRSLNKIQST